VVVLIPTVVPAHVREGILHNHFDRLLSHALRHRPDVVVAKVPMELASPSAGGR
jgi:hypothetical protein